MNTNNVCLNECLEKFDTFVTNDKISYLDIKILRFSNCLITNELVLWGHISKSNVASVFDHVIEIKFNHVYDFDVDFCLYSTSSADIDEDRYKYCTFNITELENNLYEANLSFMKFKFTNAEVLSPIQTMKNFESNLLDNRLRWFLARTKKYNGKELCRFTDLESFEIKLESKLRKQMEELCNGYNK